MTITIPNLEGVRCGQDVPSHCQQCECVTYVDSQEAVNKIVYVELQHCWKPMDIAPEDGTVFVALWVGKHKHHYENTQYSDRAKEFMPCNRTLLTMKPVCWKTIEEYEAELKGQF